MLGVPLITLGKSYHIVFLLFSFFIVTRALPKQCLLRARIPCDMIDGECSKYNRKTEMPIQSNAKLYFKLLPEWEQIPSVIIFKTPIDCNENFCCYAIYLKFFFYEHNTDYSLYIYSNQIYYSGNLLNLAYVFVFFFTLIFRKLFVVLFFFSFEKKHICV